MGRTYRAERDMCMCSYIPRLRIETEEEVTLREGDHQRLDKAITEVPEQDQRDWE